MKKLFALLVLTVGSVAIQSSLYADIFLSIASTDASFQEGSGIREVKILGRSNAADRLIGLTADLKGSGGTRFSFVSATQFNEDNIDKDPLSPTFDQVITSGPFYTKYFSENGFVGFNNINRGGGSSIAILAGDNTVANMSLEYNNAQLFPATDTPIGKLRIDITGLALGSYSIAFTDIVANNATTQVPSPLPTSAGFFTIVVPEPTSFALVVGAMVVGFSARRRRELAL